MATIINMPKLSDTMTVGTLVAWLKKEGDKVEAGDMIAEVETDKATMELENFEEGVLLAHYIKEGEEVPVGSPICVIGKEGEEAPASPPKKSSPKEEVTGSAPETAPHEVDSSPDTTEEPKTLSSTGIIKPSPSSAHSARATSPLPSERDSHKDGSQVKASPLARKIAQEHNISLEALQGTGPGKRIVKPDVIAAIEKGIVSPPSPASESQPAGAPTYCAPTPIAQESAIPISNMRAVIARRLVEAKTQIPHFYLEIEIDAAPLMELRTALNRTLAEVPPEKGGLKLTVNDFILKASAETLRRVPAVNTSWTDPTIQQHGSVHLAFGVAIEDGLLTPVIRDAQTKPLRQISAEAKTLIAKARDRKLKPEEMSGSTFTVTNLGMFGINSFYGIINSPNAALLSVGATLKKPVVDENDTIVIGQHMVLGLSGDHRAVDGATGAKFLAALKEILETPALMLV